MQGLKFNISWHMPSRSWSSVVTSPYVNISAFASVLGAIAPIYQKDTQCCSFLCLALACGQPLSRTGCVVLFSSSICDVTVNVQLCSLLASCLLSAPGIKEYLLQAYVLQDTSIFCKYHSHSTQDCVCDGYSFCVYKLIPCCVLPKFCV